MSQTAPNRSQPSQPLAGDLTTDSGHLALLVVLRAAGEIRRLKIRRLDGLDLAIAVAAVVAIVAFQWAWLMSLL